jgi:peptidoglycan glycosyltransferase
MNKIANRAWCAAIFALILFFGLCTIVVRYVRDSEEWYLHQSSGSTHTGGKLNGGRIYDRAGELLLDASEGRKYPEDEILRRSTLHLLGDVQGNIPDYVMEDYADEMISYSLFGGVQEDTDAAIELTVNGQVQKIAYEAMAGRKGTVGVYNYLTGEILCMVSTPGFDPTNPSEVNDSVEYEGAYINRFIHGKYTPGSIFKLVTSTAAIAEIPDLESRRFYCPGDWVEDDVIITCNGIHKELDFDMALTKSCNVVFSQLAVELGKKTLQKYAEQMGLMEQLEFDGFKTSKGSVDLSEASRNYLGWAGIGQYTNQVNPCQYLTVVGAIANGGVAAKPYVVSRVHCGQEETYRAATTFLPSIMEEEVANRLADAMHFAVVNNYGEQNFAGLYAGGKSGTAERGGELVPNALFTGFVKDERYPLAYIAIVEGGDSGSQTCVPIISQVLNACVAALNTES